MALKVYKPVRIFNSKKKKAEKMISSFFDENGVKKKTSIEKTIEKVLIDLGYSYVYDFPFHGKIYDFKVMCKKRGAFFLMENHGGYHHAESYIKGEKKKKDLTKYQKGNVKNDEYKVKLAKDYGVPLLVLWESEINTSLHMCRERIVEWYNKYSE